MDRTFVFVLGLVFVVFVVALFVCLCLYVFSKGEIH